MLAVHTRVTFRGTNVDSHIKNLFSENNLHNAVSHTLPCAQTGMSCLLVTFLSCLPNAPRIVFRSPSGNAGLLMEEGFFTWSRNVRFFL